MRYLPRRLMGLCLVPILLTCLDCALTLAGQPTEYWAGEHTRVKEVTPILHQLLAYHPLAFVAGKAALLLAFIGMLLLMPHNSAMVLSILQSLGGLLAAESWLLHTEYRYGPEALCGLALVTVVGMVVGIRWAWQAESSGTRLPFGLRYAMILMLFVIWLTVVFLSSRKTSIGWLVSISPLLLFFTYCSCEYLRQVRQRRRELC